MADQREKDAIKSLGRQFRQELLHNNHVFARDEDIYSITLSYKGSILKSVMRELVLDYKEPLDINYQVEWEYFLIDDNGTAIDRPMGKFYVYSCEKQEDTNSYRIVCYDDMIKTMIPYTNKKLTEDTTFDENKNYYEFSENRYTKYDETTGNPSELGLYEDFITYPITIRNYISAICNYLGITFNDANTNFTNYDKEIPYELYLTHNDDETEYYDNGYTFRDVFDELAQATGSTICIGEFFGGLDVRYIREKDDVIDEEFFKDINVNFGKKYGPVNSIVLSRSADSDNIYLRDEESVEENGLCEIKISDNQIMNRDDRDEYLPGLLERLNGLEYYLNDYVSTGLVFLFLCDKYTVSIGDNTYSCIMFNDEIIFRNGLVENVYTEEPETSVTDYTKSDKTDRKINQTTLIVDKQNGIIEGLVSATKTLDMTVNNNYQELNDKFNGYVPTSGLVEIQNSVTQLQTDTYTKTQIDTKLIDGSVKLVQTASATYSEDGMTYEKSNSNTKTTINEIGVVVKDNNDNSILFAGYVDDSNTQYSDFRGQTIVATDNIMVDNYLIVGNHCRMENYETGTGFFYIS